jgi:hypothetical protein
MSTWNREYQLEIESIATGHLKRIGAWLEPRFEAVPGPAGISRSSQHRDSSPEPNALFLKPFKAR